MSERVTIFDIKPYSYWRNLHKAAYRGWENLGQDTPRIVIEVDLLRQVNQRLRWELGCALQQLDATNQRRGQEWHRMSKRLTEACDLAAERGQQLRWAQFAAKVAHMAYQLATVPDPPISHETPVLGPDTPASGGGAEIAAILPATQEGNADEPTR